ncbi:YncE family protein [Streptomyces katrae]|uniref:YncE family protein n=1 Tax=Streptomyces katrae TaxID=68223 RepID=UPI001FE1EFD5|nr:hypothetical protein [Streptomyces katrae]
MTSNQEMWRRAAVVLCAAAAMTGQGHPAGASAGTPSAALVYVADLHADTVSVVDPAAGRVVDAVPVGSGPDSVAAAPDGSRVYVTDSAADTVSVIDARSRKVIATVPVGDEPSRVTVSPDSEHVYVANVASDTGAGRRG